MAQPAAAEPRAHVRDRAGRGPARLRLLPRDPQADRPAALAEAAGNARSRGVADPARAAPARDARRARADVREVRPAALDAAGHRAAGHHRRAARPPGRRHAVPVRAGRAGRARGARAADREAVHRRSRRRRSRRRRSARCTARRCRTASASPSRCSARTRRDRSRPTSRSSTRRRRSRRSASARSTSSTRASSSTSSPARSGTSSTTARRGGTPRRFHRNFAGDPHVRIPHVYWSYTRAARADARAPRGRCRSPTSSSDGVHARRAAPPRLPDDRGVDDDDLPARVLPRRPASGEHPRPDQRRPDRPRRLRPGREARPTTTCPS